MMSNNPRKQLDPETGVREPLLQDESPESSSSSLTAAATSTGVEMTPQHPPAYNFEREVQCPNCKKTLLSNGDYVKLPIDRMGFWRNTSITIVHFILLVLFAGLLVEGLESFIRRMGGHAPKCGP
jgi:hypothetical protein